MKIKNSVGRTRMINLPAELGWISKNLPLGPWPSGCALGPRALGQVFIDPPSLCWQVYPRPVTFIEYSYTRIGRLSKNIYMYFMSRLFDLIQTMSDCVSALCERETIIYFLTGIAWQGAPLSEKCIFAVLVTKLVH